MSACKRWGVGPGWLAVCLAAMALLIAGGARADDGDPVVPKQHVANYDVSGPYVSKNLAVYLVHGPDAMNGKTPVTLQDAMRNSMVKFNWGDSIENKSHNYVYVEGGDIAKGADQDRTPDDDDDLPPNSGPFSLSMFCVEHDRSFARGNEPSGQFGTANDCVPTRSIAMALRSKNQDNVWANVATIQQTLAARIGVDVKSPASPSSLQLTLESMPVRNGIRPYINDLVDCTAMKPDAIGYAVAINGKLVRADVYGSHELFMEMWPKHIKGAAIEALMSYDPNAKIGDVPAAELAACFVDPLGLPTALHRSASGFAILTVRESKTAYLYQSQAKDALLAFIHRCYLMK